MGKPLDPRVIDDIELVNVVVNPIPVASGSPTVYKVMASVSVCPLKEDGTRFQGKTFDSSNSAVPYFTIVETLVKPDEEQVLQLIGIAMRNEFPRFVAQLRWDVAGKMTKGFVLHEDGITVIRILQ
jgi:hypothetical protein